MNTLKSYSLLLFLFFTFLLSVPVFSQSPGNTVGKATYISNYHNDSDNAYLIENQGLNAREFGQIRTVAARLRFMEEQRKAVPVCAKANKIIVKSRKLIHEAKIRLNTDKKTGRISVEDIHKQQIIIQQAEIKLNALETSLRNAQKITTHKVS